MLEHLCIGFPNIGDAENYIKGVETTMPWLRSRVSESGLKNGFIIIRGMHLLEIGLLKADIKAKYPDSFWKGSRQGGKTNPLHKPSPP